VRERESGIGKSGSKNFSAPKGGRKKKMSRK
jgi:hypothetical protein